MHSGFQLRESFSSQTTHHGVIGGCLLRIMSEGRRGFTAKCKCTRQRRVIFHKPYPRYRVKCHWISFKDVFTDVSRFQKKNLNCIYLLIFMTIKIQVFFKSNKSILKSMKKKNKVKNKIVIRSHKSRSVHNLSQRLAFHSFRNARMFCLTRNIYVD